MKLRYARSARTTPAPRRAASVLLAGLVACAGAGVTQAAGVPATHNATTGKANTEATMASHPYTGMWVTEDGYVRHELLPNNRYDEARGNRPSAYQGRYEVTGNRIEYWDDTGFTADGEFVDGVLYHGGMVLRREEPAGRGG